MKISKLNRLLLMVIALGIGLFIQSCSPEDVEQQEIREVAAFSLSSPSGLTLATDVTSLKKSLFDESEGEVDLTKVEIVEINYHESNEASIAVVNFTDNAIEKSVLIPLMVAKGKGLYDDGKQVYIQKLNPEDPNLVQEGNSEKVGGEIRIHCSGNCFCGWTQTGPSSFNCGCAPPYAGSCSISISVGLSK